MLINTTLKKTMTLAALAVVTAAAALTVAPQAQADFTLTPGDKFHLVFVTAGTRDATSTDINVYNNFVQTQATNGGLDTIFGQSVTWKAIGSTATVDARDNIGIINAPIFRTDGLLVASNEGDLFDGTINVPIVFDQFGVEAPSELVWTGSFPDGSADLSVLGNDSGVMAGSSGGSDFNWIQSELVSLDATPLHRLYAMSSEITYVPEPASAAMFAVALGALTLRRRRRIA